MSSYAIHASPEALTSALALARGTYQRAIIMGSDALSGATLKGKAKSWSGKYLRSRKALMERLESEGLAIEVIGDHGKRILAIGFTDQISALQSL